MTENCRNQETEPKDRKLEENDPENTPEEQNTSVALTTITDHLLTLNVFLRSVTENQLSLSCVSVLAEFTILKLD